MTTTSATAEIRRTLDLAFDDLALSALCMDYFPEVYNRFSQGMRKDYKIMLLLDHCRRIPDHFERLLKAVRKEETSLAKSATKAPAFSSFPPSQRAGICPFEYGSTVPPERFYGRHSQRLDIKTRIGGISAQCVSIVGLRRSGKSSLLRYIEERLHEFCRPEQQAFVVTIDLQDNRFQTPLDLVEGLRRGIKRQIGRPPWQRDENDDKWAVGDGLEELRDMGKQLIVLIDEFELLGSRLEVFQGWGKDWRSKASKGYFTLVIASLRPLEEIYQANGLSSPFGNIFHHTELGAFTDDDWQKLVREGFARSGEDMNEADLALIYDLAGGSPYYTQMAATLLWQHDDHKQTRAAFVHQAKARFVELWDDLKQNERQALRHTAGVYRGATPHTNLQAALQRYGLLRADGKLFSSPFTDFVRDSHHFDNSSTSNTKIPKVKSSSKQKASIEVREVNKSDRKASSNSVQSVNDMLSFAERAELVQYLLAIESIADDGSRATIISQLRSEIKTNVRKNSVNKTHVFNIVNACLQYPCGMQELRDILEFFEGDSIPMQQFKQALNRLLPRELGFGRNDDQSQFVRGQS